MPQRDFVPFAGDSSQLGVPCAPGSCVDVDPSSDNQTVADVLEVGEKCFEDELYQAAKLLFTSISNWARLATTLIYLGENQAAVESARKAGNTQ